jgi:hypothetical protein
MNQTLPPPTRKLYRCVGPCRNNHALRDDQPQTKRDPYICVTCLPLRGTGYEAQPFAMTPDTVKLCEQLRGLKRKESPISFHKTAKLIEDQAAEIHRLRELIRSGYIVTEEKQGSE